MRKHNFNNTFKCLMKIGIFVLGICLIIASTNDGDIPYIAPAEVPAPPPPPPTPWKWGLMADTQWTPYQMVFEPEFAITWGYDPEGTNPNSVSGSVLTQMNQAFINHGVEFVIQVGDLTDTGTDEGIASRATLAQALYDAGIGFFGFRGNHETYINFYYPDADPNSYAIPAMQANFPQNQGVGDHLFGATNFSSPTSETYPNMATELNGISFAFDYGDEEDNDATFVIFDPWPTDTKDGFMFGYYRYGYMGGDQQEWISGRLNSATRGTEHAFVFSHQPLIGGNHYDSPFGRPDDAAEDQNTFYADLVANDVAFYISGHDHMHHRDMLVSPDGLSSVEQLIAAPACPKFYHADYGSSSWGTGKSRQIPISTEWDNVGYYIYTVDGPMVTVDYYSDATGGYQSTNDWPDGSGSLITPTFNFVKKETWRYSKNGQAFMIAQGEDYSVVSDSYGNTSMALDGVNTSTSVEDDNPEEGPVANLTKRVTTAWKDQPDGLVSDILMLDGMNETGVDRTGAYVLSMTVNTPTLSFARIVVQTETGEWVNAAGLTRGDPTFVSGASSTSYAVGTYGVNSATNTAWAVLDYDGTFAIKVN